jgi:xanthine/CO dehydrogenase XdhC/CoxF family maturation factor
MPKYWVVIINVVDIRRDEKKRKGLIVRVLMKGRVRIYVGAGHEEKLDVCQSARSAIEARQTKCQSRY